MKKYLFLIMLSTVFAQCHPSKEKSPAQASLDPLPPMNTQRTSLQQNRISKAVFDNMVKSFNDSPCKTCLVKFYITPNFNQELLAKYPAINYNIAYIKARYSAEGAVRYRNRWDLADQQQLDIAIAEGKPPTELNLLKAQVEMGNVENYVTQVIGIQKKGATTGVYIDRFDAGRICPPPSPCLTKLDTLHFYEIIVDTL